MLKIKNNKVYKGGGFYIKNKYKSNPFYFKGEGIISDFLIDEGKKLLQKGAEKTIQKGSERVISRIKKDPTINQILNKWTGNGIKRI